MDNNHTNSKYSIVQRMGPRHGQQQHGMQHVSKPACTGVNANYAVKL